MTYHRIKPRRDTAANWSSENPVLDDGELGYDTTNKKFKMGNGATAWNSLDFSEDATMLRTTDVDDTPVDGVTNAPVSSNWAYDHAANVTSLHLPDQSGGNGKILKTNGSSASWESVVSVLDLMSALSADHSYHGLTADLTAGTALALPNLCRVGSDGKMELTDADAAATMPGIALATESINENSSGIFLLVGFFRDDSWDWTPGGMLYASATPGALTQTAPSGSGDVVQIVGVAITADVIYFTPFNGFIELA